MNRNDLLTLSASIFGQSRLVTTCTNLGLRPSIAQTVLEVKGHKDGAWRPLGNVMFDQYSDLIVGGHAKALSEDVNRAGAVFNVD